MATRTRPLWQESILLVAIAIVLSVVVKTYWSGQPERGDVVVFKDSGNWLDSASLGTPNPLQRGLGALGMRPADDHLVKRVIGRAGDRVDCCDAKGHLEVNGTAVAEPYLFDQSSTRDMPFDVTVPPDRLWVMGDNRGDSADSRAHRDGPGLGFVPVDDVVGKVLVVVWPWKDRAVLHDPVGRSG